MHKNNKRVKLNSEQKSLNHQTLTMQRPLASWSTILWRNRTRAWRNNMAAAVVWTNSDAEEKDMKKKLHWLCATLMKKQNRRAMVDWEHTPQGGNG